MGSATRSEGRGAPAPCPMGAGQSLPLPPTGSNVRLVSLCYALRAPIVRLVVSRVPAHFEAIMGVVCCACRRFYLF